MRLAFQLISTSIRRPSRSAELQTAAYRLVQEALTNVIKHAGAVPAQVTVTVDASTLVITVRDAGAGSEPPATTGLSTGHGLVGMNERVASLGGTLSTGLVTGGGFEIRALIPLSAKTDESPPPEPAAAPSTNAMQWRWLDPFAAGALLVLLEVAVGTSSYRRGPFTLSAAAVGTMALMAIWRRSRPLMFFLSTEAIAAVMTFALIPPRQSAVLSAYLLLVPTYSIGAWATRSRAALGLGLMLGLAVVNHEISHQGVLTDLIGAGSVAIAACGVGGAVQGRRRRNAKLSHDLDRIVQESDDRMRLAVAGERSRIARGMHSSLAGSLSVMVVQAQAALAQLDHDPASAATAMAAMEETGRHALGEMRRILGVLRHAREEGQAVELSVEGIGLVSPFGSGS